MRLPLIITFLFSFTLLSAQQTQNLMLEPELNLFITTETKWSFTFGLANRGILVEKLDAETFSENRTKHLEINHFTHYSTGDISFISLGIRYRLREIFDVPNEDEIRLIQQFYSGEFTPFKGWHHRGRFEQRFRNSGTTFRLRYQVEYWKPLNENFSLGINTEALYSISANFSPQPEQRVALLTHQRFFKNWELKAGIEYRMDNYTGNGENNAFILTWFTYNL